MIDRPAYISRIEPFVGKNVIKVLVGARRSGKSTLLNQIRTRLLNEVNEDNVLSMNFESSEFMGITDAKNLMQYIRKNINSNAKCCFFFDEIQEVAGWEKALRSFMVDYDVDIYVTGSNASILSSDLATHITGRYIEIPVYPLSFKEWLSGFTQRNKTDVQNKRPTQEFFKFLKQGGFPFQAEIGFAEQPTLQYVNDVYSTILLRDVMQRYGFRDAEQLIRIIEYAIREVGHVFSAQSIANYLKSEHRSVSVDTVYKYMRAAQDACLLYRAPREDTIGKRTLKFNEKLYVVDTGIRESLGTSNQANIDQVLENIVFMELLRRGYDVKVGKVEDKEIDFVATKGEYREYFQVSYLLADEHTRKREFGSLEMIGDNFPKYVLSMDEIEFSQNGISSKNIIDWLLED